MLPNHSAPSKLPQWAYWAILILIIPAGAGSIYLTREYSFANLTLLQLDDSSRAARKLSIDVLLFAHVVAFFVGPVLFDTRLKWRRRQLLLLGFAIWLFDCAALYQSRVGIMISADSVQTTTADKAKKKQENIESMRRQVLSLQKLAETQLALNRVKAATATTADATELEKKANDKAAELDDEPTSTGLTEVKVWGAAAPYKAFVESLLISFTTLVMLGMQGAIVRVMLERVTPDIQQAATNFSRPENALLKRSIGRVLRGALAALGIGAAAATATAGEAPTAPGAALSQPVNDDTSTPVNVDGSTGRSEGERVSTLTPPPMHRPRPARPVSSVCVMHRAR